MTLTLAPPTLANAADVHLRIATLAATSQQLQTEAQELQHKLQERIAPLAQRHLRCMELQEEAAKVSEAPIPERTDLESVDYVTLTSRDGKRCKLPFHVLHAYAPRVANIAYPKLLHGLPAEMAMDVDGNSLERFSEIVNPCIPDALSNWNTWQEGAAALELLAAIQSYTDDESFFSSCQSRLKKRADTFKAISLEELEAWLMAATKLPSLGTKRDLCNLAMQCYSASPGSQVYVHYQRKEGRWQTRLELIDYRGPLTQASVSELCDLYNVLARFDMGPFLCLDPYLFDVIPDLGELLSSPEHSIDSLEVLPRRLPSESASNALASYVASEHCPLKQLCVDHYNRNTTWSDVIPFANSLSEAIGRNRSLNYLHFLLPYLSEEDDAEVDATYLERIAANQSIEQLRLTGAIKNERHSHALATILYEAKALKKLTDVEIRCWDHLLPAFKRNTSLKHLTLGDFNRNQSIDSDLRKLLQHNTGIESLKLYHHFFNQSSLDLLTPGLEENRTLKLLRIGGFKSKTKSDVLRPSPKITCTIESE